MIPVKKKEIALPHRQMQMLLMVRRQIIRYDVKRTPISGFEIAQKMGIIVIPYSGLSRKARREAKKVSRNARQHHTGRLFSFSEGGEMIWEEEERSRQEIRSHIHTRSTLYKRYKHFFKGVQ